MKAVLRAALPHLYCAAMGLALLALVFLWARPIPIVSDEFSYLLMGDTFASGQLAAPAPPSPLHFESPQILVNPTYASKYPPLQGIFIAIGYCLGDPIIGVWISYLLSVSTLLWMLRAWFPVRWALLGTILYLSNVTLLLTWGATFYGGAPTFLCANIALGALGRHLSRPRLLTGWLSGLGFGGLILSRPYEGAVFGLCLLILLGRNVGELGFSGLAKLVVPAGLLVVLATVFTAYLNYRVTGSALQLPYVLYEREYSEIPVFLFLAPRNPPIIHNRELREFERSFQAPLYYNARTLKGGVSEAINKTIGYLGAFVSVGAALLLVLVLVWRNVLPGLEKLLGWCVMSLAISWIALLVETYAQFHYAAPFLPILMVALTGGIVVCQKKFPAQSKWILGCVLIVGTVQHISMSNGIVGIRGASDLVHRPAIESSIREKGGKHIIFVKYSATRKLLAEWVYNEANLSESSIIWSRARSASDDRILLGYYPDRTAWLFTPDQGSRILRPYAP